MKLFIQLIILNEYRKKLKLDWVGSSFIGQVAHLSNYIEIPNVEILALAELRPKLGEIACKKYGILRYYKDHNKLLTDTDTDILKSLWGNTMFYIAFKKNG